MLPNIPADNPDTTLQNMYSYAKQGVWTVLREALRAAERQGGSRNLLLILAQDLAAHTRQPELAFSETDGKEVHQTWIDHAGHPQQKTVALDRYSAEERAALTHSRREPPVTGPAHARSAVPLTDRLAEHKRRSDEELQDIQDRHLLSSQSAQARRRTPDGLRDHVTQLQADLARYAVPGEPDSEFAAAIRAELTRSEADLNAMEN